jgi:DNA (cytosine-5)-methyltransferase 1
LVDGLTMVGAVDAWDIAAATYGDNFPIAKVVNAKLTDKSGPEVFRRFGKVDMLIASPECTHHSIARGNKLVDQESQRSGWYVMNFIKKLDPRWVVLENVTPMRNWPGFDELIATLQKTYKLRIGPLDAADFGTPQSRRRLFIVGDQLVTPTIALPGMKATRDATCILEREGNYAAEPVYHGKRAASMSNRFQPRPPFRLQG